MTARQRFSSATLAAVILAALPVVSYAQQAPSPTTAAPTASTPLAPIDQAIAQDIQQLAGVLSDPVATPVQREEAAKRLVERPSPESDRVLQDILKDTANTPGRYAIATALTNANSSNAAFVPLLTSMLGSEPQLTAAAATALATSYGDDNAARVALNTYVKTAPANPRNADPARLAAITAMGALADKNSADTLMQLVQSNLEPAVVRDTAAGALVTMTGQSANGTDPSRWARWWETAGKQSDADFLLSVLTSRSPKASRLQRREQHLETRVQQLLKEQFDIAPRDQKAALLAKYLADEDAVVRIFGANKVVEDALSANPPSAATRERLRTMIGDSDPSVRAAVATTVQQINDSLATDSLRIQLAQETDRDALLAELTALGKVGDARAVSVVAPLLADPDNTIATAAARALATLNTNLQQFDPTLAAKVKLTLIDTLRGRAAKAGAEPLRAATVNALSPLADSGQLQLFLQLLNQREAPIVRIAALDALARLGDSRAADEIARLPDPRDTAEHDVREAAVRALGYVGSFDNMNILLPRMDAATEPDEGVRRAANATFERLLPSGDRRQLKALADQSRDNPQRRVIIQQQLVEKLKAANNRDLPFELQNLGEYQALVGMNREAAGSFKSAIDLFLLNGQKMDFVETLVGSYIKALLKSNQYAEAAKYSNDAIAQGGPGMSQTVGETVKRETEELRTKGDLNAAVRLPSVFKDLPLGRYNGILDQLQKEIQNELSQKTLSKPAGNAQIPSDWELAASDCIVVA